MDNSSQRLSVQPISEHFSSHSYSLQPRHSCVLRTFRFTIPFAGCFLPHDVHPACSLTFKRFIQVSSSQWGPPQPPCLNTLTAAGHSNCSNPSSEALLLEISILLLPLVPSVVCHPGTFLCFSPVSDYFLYHSFMADLENTSSRGFLRNMGGNFLRPHRSEYVFVTSYYLDTEF